MVVVVELKCMVNGMDRGVLCECQFWVFSSLVVCPSVGLCVIGCWEDVWGQQREQSMVCVAGVTDAPPGVDVLDGGKLTSFSVAGSFKISPNKPWFTVNLEQLQWI